MGEVIREAPVVIILVLMFKLFSFSIILGAKLGYIGDFREENPRFNRSSMLGSKFSFSQMF